MKPELSGISQRFLKAMESLGVTGYKLSKEIDEISEPKLTNIRTGRNNPSLTILEAFIRRYPNINGTWLLTGEGEMFSDGKVPVVPVKSKTIVPPGAVPLVEQEAVGGFGNNDFAIAQKDVVDNYVIPDFQKASFLIRVRGNSMEPKYSSGDIVACLILKETTFIQWNEIHVIATREQGILIKRILEGDNGSILAVSENKEYPPFSIPKNEITGLALVLGGVRLE